MAGAQLIQGISLCVSLPFLRPGLNNKSELLMERTLADKISWYLSFVREEQAQNSRVTVNAIAVHLQSYHQEV